VGLTNHADLFSNCENDEDELENELDEDLFDPEIPVFMIERLSKGEAEVERIKVQQKVKKEK
jgi:hypothetical protein